jgi:hypothetical protein
MDGELTRQVRDLVQTMREKRQRLEETLEEVQVSLLRVQINAAELAGRTDAIRLSCPAGPPELVDESVLARATIAESYELERHWKHIRPRAPRHPGS